MNTKQQKDPRRYKTRGTIGSGAIAVVFLANCLVTGSLRALKRVPHKAVPAIEEAHRLLAASNHVAHPVEPPFEHDGFWWIAYQLYDYTLRPFSNRARFLLPVHFATLYLVAVGKIIRDCYRVGAVASDLNPENVMVVRRNGNVFTHLVDVGSVVRLGNAHKGFEYTDPWRAPEMHHGVLHPNTASWQFSAIALWAAGLGRWTDPDLTARSILRELSWLGPELADLLALCSSQDPDKRLAPDVVSSTVDRLVKLSGSTCQAGHWIFRDAPVCACGKGVL